MTALNRMIYIDDSGNPRAGTAVFGWVEFPPDRWSSVPRSWMDTRKMLRREFKIPIGVELHATQYVNGRGRIASSLPARHIHKGVNYWKAFGQEVALACLETLQSTEGLRIGAVYRHGSVSDVARTQRLAYAALVDQFEAELQESDGLGLIFVDGDGSDRSFRSTHREFALHDRRVIEDPIYLDSRASQFIQMADLAAWCANVHIDPHPKTMFAARWYVNYLGSRDPNREPIEI